MRTAATNTDRLTARPTISAAVPMLDEGRHAATFLRALRKALAAISDGFVIALVNDGSRDHTRERVVEVADEKEAALGAGDFRLMDRRVADAVDRSRLADRHGQSG